MIEQDASTERTMAERDRAGYRMMLRFIDDLTQAVAEDEVTTPGGVLDFYNNFLQNDLDQGNEFPLGLAQIEASSRIFDWRENARLNHPSGTANRVCDLIGEAIIL